MKKVHGGNVWDVSERLGVPATRVIDFSASINPLGLSRSVRKAIKGALPLLPSYPDPECSQLRATLASFHGLSPDEILPANGSTELIYLIPGALMPRSALIVEPAFSEYRAALTLNGCAVDSLVLKEKEGFSFDPGMLEKALRKRRYGVVFLANPANPTGALIKKDDVLRVASICNKAGIYLVVDEAFADFTEEESVKKGARRFKNLIILRSMTKFFSLTGLRLGFLIADKRIIRRFKERIPPWSVNTLASAAAIAALSDKGHTDRTIEWLGRERRFLTKGLSSLNGLTVFKSFANFVMARIDRGGRKGVDAPGLRKLLLKEGILIRDLSDFRGLGRSYFRAAVRTREENKTLLNALGGLL